MTHADSWNVVLTIAVLVNIAVGVLALARTGARQKREVTFGFDAASRGDLEKHVNQTTRTHEVLFAKFDDLNATMTGEMQRIRERLAGVEKETSMVSQRLLHLEANLERLLTK